MNLLVVAIHSSVGMQFTLSQLFMFVCVLQFSSTPNPTSLLKPSKHLTPHISYNIPMAVANASLVQTDKSSTTLNKIHATRNARYKHMQTKITTFKVTPSTSKLCLNVCCQLISVYNIKTPQNALFTQLL